MMQPPQSQTEWELSVSEEWRPISGLRFHEVSDLGRVRRLGKYVVHRPGSRPIWRDRRIVKQSLTTTGYPRISVSEDGRKLTKAVHRLVGEAFLGPLPDGLVTCHEDGNRLNSALSNLRYDTPLSNIHDAIRHGTYWSLWVTHCPAEHLLQPPNLVASRERRGRKACLACNRARQWCRKHPEQDSSALADLHYAVIMAPSDKAALSRLHEVTGRPGCLAPLHPRNTSGFKGVTWDKRKNKWLARAKHHGKMKYLGMFDTAEAAGAARREFDASVEDYYFPAALHRGAVQVVAADPPASATPVAYVSPVVMETSSGVCLR